MPPNAHQQPLQVLHSSTLRQPLHQRMRVTNPSDIQHSVNCQSNSDRTSNIRFHKERSASVTPTSTILSAAIPVTSTSHLSLRHHMLHHLKLQHPRLINADFILECSSIQRSNICRSAQNTPNPASSASTTIPSQTLSCNAPTSIAPAARA